MYLNDMPKGFIGIFLLSLQNKITISQNDRITDIRKYFAFCGRAR